MCMWRNAIALWKLEPKHKQTFLVGIAKQDRRLRSGREHGWCRSPLDVMRRDARVARHRVGQAGEDNTSGGYSRDQRWQCDFHGKPPVWAEPFTTAAQRAGNSEP